MLELSRLVRFSIPLASLRDGGPPVLPAADDPLGGRHNSFAAWPSTDGVGLFCQWEVRCRGEADPRTGYLVGISEIDAAVRGHALESVAAVLRERPGAEPASILAAVMPRLDAALDGRVHEITWHLTPWHRVRLEHRGMDRFEIRQQFDFAAAHHLQSPELDAAANRRVFGKCTNPHGHNYRLEVAVSVPMPAAGHAAAIGLRQLEQLVDHHVVQRLDHTDLNELQDVFAGNLPSVENIARACHRLLAAAVAEAGGHLSQVTVWETEKTSCTYPAGPVGDPHAPAPDLAATAATPAEAARA